MMEMFLRHERLAEPNGETNRFVESSCRELARDMDNAHVYYLNLDVLRIVDAGAQTLEDDLRRLLRTLDPDGLDTPIDVKHIPPQLKAHPLALKEHEHVGPGFVWLDGEGLYVGPENGGELIPVRAIQWGDIKRGPPGGNHEHGFTYIIPYGPMREGPFKGEVVPLSLNIWCVDEPFAEAVGMQHPVSLRPNAFVTSLLAFTHQKIAEVEEHDPPREYRRRAEKQQRKWRPIRVVLLRKRESRPSPAESGGEHKQVDWTCRWYVEPHPRLQPYRSTGEKKLIWIDGYVKGPEDKPLKTPTKVVYAAVR